MTDADLRVLLQKLDKVADAIRDLSGWVSAHIAAEELPADVLHLARTQSIVAAIGRLREIDGSGVLEAKRRIERAVR